MAVIVAGPLSNFLCALVLLCIAFMAGWPVLASEIGKVMEDSPAMEAGLQPNDVIVAVDGETVRRWQDMRRLIEQKPEQPVALTVDRSGGPVETTVVPSLSEDKDVFGNPVGRIGVMPSGRQLELGLAESVYEGTRFTFYLTGLVVETLGKLVTGQISAKALSGPITIAQASGESLRAGFLSFVFLMSFISINLAVINLLPIPILDGGHLLFFLVEAVIRRPVTGRAREVATQLGLVFIVFLMVLVFYNDISRIVTSGWSLKP
jgi:regulator of sigma E protease